MPGAAWWIRGRAARWGRAGRVRRRGSVCGGGGGDVCGFEYQRGEWDGGGSLDGFELQLRWFRAFLVVVELIFRVAELVGLCTVVPGECSMASYFRGLPFEVSEGRSVLVRVITASVQSGP